MGMAHFALERGPAALQTHRRPLRSASPRPLRGPGQGCRGGVGNTLGERLASASLAGTYRIPLSLAGGGKKLRARDPFLEDSALGRGVLYGNEESLYAFINRFITFREKPQLEDKII